MELKVKYDELEEIGKFLTSKSNELNTCFDNLKSIINSIDDGWKGKDSETFVKEANEYMDKKEDSFKKVEDMGKILTVISNNYKNKDREWANAVKEGELL